MELMFVTLQLTLLVTVVTGGRRPCLDAATPLTLKYFYPESVAFNITLASGDTEESRWVAGSRRVKLRIQYSPRKGHLLKPAT